MSAFEHDEVTILTSVDGEPVALHDFGGRADGPPLLLTHGNGLNAGMWAGALPDLATTFRCWGLDLRGHGRARPTAPGYSVERARFAADIVTAVEAIGQPVHLAAHSLGAASAVNAAVANPPASDLFLTLWLYEPVLVTETFDRRGEGPGMLVEMSRRRRMEFDSVADAVARFRSKPPFVTCDERAVEGYVEIGTVPVEGGVRLSCEGEDEARVFETIATVDAATLATVEVPALVVSGAAADAANALPPRLAPVVAEALGRARWFEYEGLSHFGPMENPAGMARSIIDHATEHTG